MNKEYVAILKDSLVKKVELLNRIYELSLTQSEIIKKDEIDWDSFNTNVEDKGQLVEEVLKLDDGFEKVYEEVREVLKEDKKTYKSDIVSMQEMIKRITEISANIEATEQRNKSEIEKQFDKTRKNIKQGKKGTQAALQYYQKMSKTSVVAPQFMDKNG